MRNRASHKSKTVTERVKYQKALAKVDSDPTIDESIDFKQSNKMDDEKTETISTKKRPISLGQKVKKYISNNWVSLVISIFLGVLSVLFAFSTYLFVDSKIAISSIQKDIETQQQQLDGLSSIVNSNDSESKRQIQLIQSDIDKLRDKVDNSNKIDSTQDVMLAEIKLKIEFMLESMNEKK
jgi:cell division protein FtsB